MVIRNNSPLPSDLFLLFQRERKMKDWESFTNFTLNGIDITGLKITVQISQSFI